MTNKSERVTTKQLAELIQGKNLSAAEIYRMLDEAYPDHSMSRDTILRRLHTMVRSPSVEMIKTGQGNKARFQLIHASPRYLELSDINFRSKESKKSDTTLWHFNPTELRYCQLHKMFDQALAGVQKGAV
ncbi:hypothetical protein FS595_10405 [Serratia rubidaea]|uniref:transcriptional repressor n=1 Tax=Serratia rubidaea TaxID=61652 RepID=UPI001F3FC98E|nr:transcriptional repressor [Serratia rubidaea]UJD80090.1 hypothetical protein FS596_10405 [Serratia rubidaea]UJD84646.1 hypothetical protein FS595_10405 [Serratia rubidaea]HDJ1441629.1 hypothetical protein [Serratia rubidaea]HDJ1447216.1 hypothetical protein [Serratia rubidaea]HDJ1463257.1 hypothetical protein [Serratia rubidaea]